MGKINVLGFEIANLIAAGEVVDRPASVLKELLENAIDAGGRHVTAEICRGGVRSIRVMDDGCGMLPEDMPVALRRHATSKITSADDLNAIMTLGFRGEALAAISSVSEIHIISKTAGAETGTMLTADGGTVTDLSEVGAADGTTVLVENLFAKVPARRKFLKKDLTEAMACTALMEKVAMSHPEIAFRFLIDGTVKFTTVGDGDVKNTLYALFGRDFATRLLPLDSESDGVRVSGYVGRSDNSHGNRNKQNVFINGRYVKSKTVMAALERAFTSYMAPERYPVCVLYLETDPRHVDVNVHPTKLEVRFSDERKIFESVYWAVRAALEENTQRPEIQLKDKTKELKVTNAFVPLGGEERPRQLQMPAPIKRPATVAAPAVETAPRREEMSPADSLVFLKQLRESGQEVLREDPPMRNAPASAPQSCARPMTADIPPFCWTDARSEVTSPWTVAKETVTDTPVVQEAIHKDKQETQDTATENSTILAYRFVGEAFHTYLFVEREKELLVIDQHAAHERILFEELLKQQKRDGRVCSQGMLVPIRISLTQEECAAVIDATAEFEAVGFSFLPEENGGGVSLVAVPNAIAQGDAQALFSEMAAELAGGVGNPVSRETAWREIALHRVACKAAIKGGRIYDRTQLTWLIEKVLSLPDITVCPHGRPIAYTLTKNELDRQFDRIK